MSRDFDKTPHRFHTEWHNSCSLDHKLLIGNNLRQKTGREYVVSIYIPTTYNKGGFSVIIGGMGILRKKPPVVYTQSSPYL